MIGGTFFTIEHLVNMYSWWLYIACICVWVTYNEDSNVIVTITGGASQLRGSEFFDIDSCFLGTNQWV